MAVVLQAKRETFEVVLSFDDALDMTEEEFKAYRETLDSNLLRFHPGKQPTRWVMRQVLPFALAKKVQNSQAIQNDGKVEVALSYINEEVKAALIDIINPSDIAEDQKIIFTKDKDGTASEQLMEMLIASGIVEELFAARQVKVGRNNDRLKKR